MNTGKKFVVQTKVVKAVDKSRDEVEAIKHRRAVQPVVMDLIPDELGEFHVDENFMGRRNSLVHRTKKKIIIDQGSGQFQSGRQT